MKLKTVVTLFLLTALCMAAKSSAQTDVEPNLGKELKALQPMLGDWDFKGKLPNELPSSLKKSCVAEMHGMLVVERLSAKDDAGKDRQISLTVWRWDWQRKKLVAVSFSHDGVHNETEYAIDAKDDSKPTLTSIESKPGSPVATRQTLKIIDRQTHSWRVEATVGEGPIVDGIWKKR